MINIKFYRSARNIELFYLSSNYREATDLVLILFVLVITFFLIADFFDFIVT